MGTHAWLAVGSLLLFGCGGSSRSMPPVSVTPTAQIAGDWTVTATFVSGSGTCQVAVGQSAVGAITIEQNGTSITVHDVSGKTASGTVSGTSVEFAYAAAGVTQTWEVEVVDDETRLVGEITVDGLGCHAVAEVTGTRPSAVRSGPAGESVVPSRGTVLLEGETVAVRLPDGTSRLVAAEESAGEVVEVAFAVPVGGGVREPGLLQAIARHFVH